MAWMAWTWPTAAFFGVIAALLITFTILAIKFPETPRVGILRIETTRGDRLFITLLGSAFINLIWLGLEVAPQPYALLACLGYAAAEVRWVGATRRVRPGSLGRPQPTGRIKVWEDINELFTDINHGDGRLGRIASGGAGLGGHGRRDGVS